MKLTLTLTEAQGIIRKSLGLGLCVPVEITDIKTTLSDHARQVIADVESLINRGSKIEAIKAYRAGTGVGLWEAKTVIEGWDKDAKPLIEHTQQMVTVVRDSFSNIKFVTI
jgi:ribosomal protein L7/L12